jgi:hypothetical protein
MFFLNGGQIKTKLSSTRQGKGLKHINIHIQILLQVSGQLEVITSRLEEQHKDTLQILQIVTEIRYIDGIEKIEALFFAVVKGLTSRRYKDSSVR